MREAPGTQHRTPNRTRVRRPGSERGQTGLGREGKAVAAARRFCNAIDGKGRRNVATLASIGDQLITRRSASCAVNGAHRVALTPVSWTAAGDLQLAEWVQHGKRLGLVGRNAAWWIGDWLRYGNAKYGERYSRAATITGYDRQTLMNMVYVASRFDSSRRRGELSWSHHAEVAALPPEEQERWIDRAQAERLSVRDLRGLIRGERGVFREPAAHDESQSLADELLKHIACPNCGHTLQLPSGDPGAAWPSINERSSSARRKRLPAPRSA